MSRMTFNRAIPHQQQYIIRI